MFDFLYQLNVIITLYESKCKVLIILLYLNNCKISFSFYLRDKEGLLKNLQDLQRNASLTSIKNPQIPKEFDEPEGRKVFLSFRD